MKKFKIPRETAVTNLRDDKFGHKALSKKILDNVLIEMELPNCFGLYGNWGSGKSTLLNFIEEHLQSKQKKYEDIAVVRFEPWKYEYAKENDLLFALLRKIMDTLKVSKGKTGHELRKILLAAGSYGLKMTSSVLSVGTATIDAKEIGEHLKMSEDLMADKYNDWIDSTEEIADKIQKAIKAGLGNKKKLFIFIDDLDRCLPENTIQLLEGIKNFLSFESTLFVFAVDRRIVSEMIEQKYALQSGFGNEYLMKIIPYYYQLPQVRDKETIKGIISGYGISIFTEGVIAFIAEFLFSEAGEPRKSKHYLHQFLMGITINNALVSIEDSKDVEYDCKYLFVASFLLEKFPRVFRAEDRNEKLRNLRESAQLNKDTAGKHKTISGNYESIPTSDRKHIENILLKQIPRKGQTNSDPVLNIEQLSRMMNIISKIT